ncbi:MAG: hypothetical protein C4516_05300 [Oxalobacter sp.]|nr:MAG: hypothetical protein C4516_05300 [Oxalobacter sp.]
MAYEATNVILTALKKNPDPDKLAKTITSIGSFTGLQAPIRFDAFRDADRPSYITTILDGKFRTYEN